MCLQASQVKSKNSPLGQNFPLHDDSGE